MADMELVIKIPEEIKTSLKFGVISDELINTVCNAILNGVQLPKGHGDLIDRKVLMDNGYQMEPVEMWYGIKYAPTIIEADKG